MQNQIIKIKTKPQHAETFKAALIEYKKNTRKETHNVEMRVYVDNKDSNLFFIYERFENKAAVDLHNSQPYTSAFEKQIAGGLEASIDVFKLGETSPLPVALKDANPEDELFNIFFIFKIKEGVRDRLLKQFGEHINFTRKEEGNLLFDLFTVEEDDNTLVVYEHWRKESDVWDIHFNQPYAKVTGALMEEAVVGDMGQYMNFVTEL